MQNLWKALGPAVEALDGSQPGQHDRIVEAVENKVVAVDLSAWLMQAQTQPALLEQFDSDYARACKVVFERVRCCCAVGGWYSLLALGVAGSCACVWAQNTMTHSRP